MPISPGPRLVYGLQRELLVLLARGPIRHFGFYMQDAIRIRDLRFMIRAIDPLAPLFLRADEAQAAILLAQHDAKPIPPELGAVAKRARGARS